MRKISSCAWGLCGAIALILVSGCNQQPGKAIHELSWIHSQTTDRLIYEGPQSNLSPASSENHQLYSQTLLEAFDDLLEAAEWSAADTQKKNRAFYTKSDPEDFIYRVSGTMKLTRTPLQVTLVSRLNHPCLVSFSLSGRGYHPSEWSKTMSRYWMVRMLKESALGIEPSAPAPAYTAQSIDEF